MTVNAWSTCPLQIKSLDADNMEAQGYKAASAAADELRGMLEGSKRAGTLKSAENDALPAAFGTAAQRLGAASEAAAAAYTAVRSEVQAEALAPKVRGQRQWTCGSQAWRPRTCLCG
jgi:hypothetical protein